jgi:ferredoxin
VGFLLKGQQLTELWNFTRRRNVQLLDSGEMVLNSKVTLLIRRSQSNEPNVVEVERGENLRQVLLRESLTPYQGNKKIFNCRGMGICGTCKVLVFENGEWWDKRSCQIQCFKNLEIQLK